MKKLFTFLCAALMSAASMWAQTETLLTTITATAKEQASYSTANVATVSFSHTAGGNSDYHALWGWWGYGMTLTVTPAEGYTITKCVFYDDANRTATDSEAPFVVETTEEDKTPKVNGKPIEEDTSKGIKKIEVYGYATPTTYTLKLVADPTMGSVAVTNLLGSDIVDNGNGNYTVPENAKVTILATPKEGYEFSGWLEGNVLCDFTECGVALNTLDNPLTFTMTNDAACKAEFKAAAPAGQVITWDFFFCNEVTAMCDDGATIALDNSKNGISVTYGGYDDMDGWGGGYIYLYGASESKMIFSSTVGDISKIEIYYSDNTGGTPADWTLDATNNKFVWEGTPAASVDMKKGTAGNIGFMVDHIVFTIAGSATAVENVQTNQVQATKILRDGMLLIEKNGNIYNVQGVEVK